MQQSRFKFWLIVALLIMNLAVGVTSLHFLRSVNQRYAVQFESSVPVMNSLRTLSRELTAVQRFSRQIVDAETKIAASDLLAQMDDVRQGVAIHALEVSQRDLLKDTAHHAAILAINQEYVKKADQLRLLVAGSDLAPAKSFHVEQLRPCYDRYQVVLDAAAADVEKQGNDLRNRYDKDSRYFGGLALASTGWPVLLALLALLTLGGLVVVLLVTIFTPDKYQRRSAPPMA